MASNRSPTRTWVAKEGTVYMSTPASGVTFDDTATLSGAFQDVVPAVTIQAACKNITVTPPETSWEKQDFQGQNSNDFQNQLLDEKPAGTATLTGTLVLGEDETVENIISGTFGGAPSGYSRYQYGSDNTSSGTVAACVTLATPGAEANTVSFALDNARFTKLGDTRISGPDAHWEQDFTIMCLAKDFRSEFKD